MTTLSPYLTFAGNCEEAFTFYKSIFGGEFAYLGRFKEMPPSPDYPPIQEDDKEKIMHVSLPISKETILMGSDSSEAFGHSNIEGNNFSISINTNELNEATRLFDGLAENGTIKMPLNKTFWGAYYGMLTDKFGIHWMVNCNIEPAK